MRVLFVCLLNIFLAWIVSAQTKTPQISPASTILERAVFSDEERSFTTPEAFHASLNRARAPGGTVTIFNCKENTSKKNWKPQGQPLGQVLNEIVGADGNYRWERQDDAINLLPKSGEPLLLQTYIGEFNVRTSSSLDALAQLMKRTEVKEAMINLRLKGGFTLIMYPSNSTEFSLRFKGGTLRQALNAIAVSKGSDVWVYREFHCGERNEVTITF